MAERLQRFDHRFAHEVVVLDHQDARARARHGDDGRGHGQGVVDSACFTQPDFHRRAHAALAQDARRAAGLLGHAVHLGQAQSRALADALRREEGLEDACGDLGRHAFAAVGHRDAHVLAGRQHIRGRGGGARFEAQFAAAIHRVARIDRQVEQGHFHLVAVGHDAGAWRRDGEVQADAGTERGGDEFLHAFEEQLHVERAQVEGLVAREGQQLAGELGAALAGAARHLGAAFGHLVLRHQQDQVHAALHHVEQVVEVVRDAAGQAPDRLHLLQLHHRLLHPLALDHFVHQAVVGLGQCARAFLDARFERLVQVHQRFLALAQAGRGALAVGEHVARAVLAAPCAQGRGHGAAQGLGVQGALEQDHVAEFVDALACAFRRQADDFTQQDHEGEVGPGRLALEPGAQARQVDVGQGFLGHDRGAGAGLDVGDEGVEAGHDSALEAVAAQHRAHDLGVAPARREDQDAFVGAVIRVHRAHSAASRCCRDSSAGRSARPRSRPAARRCARRPGRAAVRGWSARGSWCGS